VAEEGIRIQADQFRGGDPQAERHAEIQDGSPQPLRGEPEPEHQRLSESRVGIEDPAAGTAQRPGRLPHRPGSGVEGKRRHAVLSGGQRLEKQPQADPNR